MRQLTLAAAGGALLAAALWHLPATAQRSIVADSPGVILAEAAAAPAATPGPAIAPGRLDATAADPITFAEYRDFRLRDIARRQARLERELAASDLAPEQHAGLAARKTYYDQLAAMPAAERDRLFRARFDQIDTNHDGVLDVAERAAWRAKQRERYRPPATLARAGARASQH